MKTNFNIKVGSKKLLRSVNVIIESSKDLSLGAQAFPLYFTVELNNIPVVYEYIKALRDSGELKVVVDKSTSHNLDHVKFKFEVNDIFKYLQFCLWIKDIQTKPKTDNYIMVYNFHLESHNDELKTLAKKRIPISKLNYRRNTRAIRIADGEATDFPVLSLSCILFAGRFGRKLYEALYQLTCQLLNVKGGVVPEEHQLEYLIRTYFAKCKDLTTNLKIHPTTR